MDGKSRLLLTVGEVVEETGYSRSFVHKMIAEGRLPGVVRLGRTVRVSADALRQWVDSQATGAPAA